MGKSLIYFIFLSSVPIDKFIHIRPKRWTEKSSFRYQSKTKQKCLQAASFSKLLQTKIQNNWSWRWLL